MKQSIHNKKVYIYFRGGGEDTGLPNNEVEDKKEQGLPSTQTGFIDTVVQP